MDNGQANELDSMVKDPTVPIENAQYLDMTLIFSGRAMKLYEAGDQLMFEFMDEDGFVNGISFDRSTDEKDFIRITKAFAEYAG